MATMGPKNTKSHKILFRNLPKKLGFDVVFLKFPLGKRYKTFCQVYPRNLVVVKANGSLDPTRSATVDGSYTLCKLRLTMETQPFSKSCLTSGKFMECFGVFFSITLPETNIASENGWLGDWFPFGMAYFQGAIR